MDNTNDTNFQGIADWDELLRESRTEGGMRASFARRLRAARYLVPRRESGSGLSLLTAQTGEFFLPAFTSAAEFGKWARPHGGAADLTFEMLHHIVVDDPKIGGIVFNPFGRSLIMRRPDLTALENAMTGMTHESAVHTGKMIIGAARCAPALVRSFTAALQKSGMDIREAYILSARQEHEGEGHLLFLVDYSGDNKLLFPRLAEAIRAHMQPGAQFELLKATPAILHAARRSTRPVWLK